MGWKLAASVALAIIGSFIFVHEMTHVYVAESYNCEADVRWTPQIDSDNFRTSTISSVKTSCPEDSEGIHSIAQRNVESVGYQLFPIYTILAYLGFAVFYYA